jgi:predicted lipid carrier protein YhbT
MFWVLVQQWVETSENDDKLVFFEDCVKVSLCVCNLQVTLQLASRCAADVQVSASSQDMIMYTA